MKFINITDLHIIGQNPMCRKDNLVKKQYDKFKFVLNYSSKNNIPILIAGDETDKPRDFYVLDNLSNIIHKGINIYCVKGQHDSYNKSEAPSVISILEKFGKITILDSTPILINNVAIYGCSWGQDVPEVKNTSDHNILVIHDSISLKEHIPVGMEYHDAKKFLRQHEKQYDFILCGDIHRRFEYRSKKGNLIINPGPMLRKEATEYMFQFVPMFAVYDTDTREIEWVEIPHSDSIDVLSRKHIEIEKEKISIKNEFIDQLKTETNRETIDFKSKLDQIIKQNKIEDDVIDIINELEEEADG